MAISITTIILLGIMTIVSLFITLFLGIAMHNFGKPVFKYHRFFAYLTGLLALTHAILAFYLFYFLR